jgi:hypothetical protein
MRLRGTRNQPQATIATIEVAALSQKVRRDGKRIATILPMAVRIKKPGVMPGIL